jgi:hypothetical protein
MTIVSIIEEIDSEIARLTEARQLLAGTGSTKAAPATKRKTKSVAAKPAVAKKSGKRTLSAEARKRIADAQRRRWAAQKSKSK